MGVMLQRDKLGAERQSLGKRRSFLSSQVLSPFPSELINGEVHQTWAPYSSNNEECGHRVALFPMSQQALIIHGGCVLLRYLFTSAVGNESFYSRILLFCLCSSWYSCFAEVFL